MLRRLAYQTRYGYRLRDALRAEAWWRLEHLPWRADGQVFGLLARFAYGRRKAAERRAVRWPVVGAGVRRRAIWCALKFGFLPSWTYEDEPHHGASYLAHLWVNLSYAARWLLRREDDDDRAFELEVNGRG